MSGERFARLLKLIEGAGYDAVRHPLGRLLVVVQRLDKFALADDVAKILRDGDTKDIPASV
ncbi:hypothetical protein OSH12_02885 [Kaistia terrae]|nr:hypothetical protein [Kaistia terrae]MCX5577208.1 hypothetical protein [Kaistia terrae]